MPALRLLLAAILAAALGAQTLQVPAPTEIGHGVSVNGVLSGLGLAQANPAAGDETTRGAISNAQAIVQKTSGWWQFYVQAGAYNLASLGLPVLSTENNISDLFGPVPVAYVKFAPAKNTAILAGVLPTICGAESVFTFQNRNILRGLLWNQENDVNRGIQINQTIGKLTATLTWNDGYYSNRYSWLGGALTYTVGPHAVSFQAMGNLSRTEFHTLATPVQNNGSMYVLVYTWSKGSWNVQPYVQYTTVEPMSSTDGGALLVTRSFSRGLSLSGRAEYITSSGGVKLLYGPASAAWSATITPTFQSGRFFVRGDLALVRLNRETAGSAFGSRGVDRTQPRALIEAGILF